jgi:hypothetical protein
MSESSWLDELISWHDLLIGHGAIIQSLEIEPPATMDEMRSAEARVGRPLPRSLRRVLFSFGRRVRFKWFLEEGPSEPRELKDLSRFGELHWDVVSLKRYRSDGEDWRDDLLTYGESGAQLMRESIVFQEVGNGDALAVDCRSGEVVYLDHEGGPAHGIVLASSFAKFVDAYTAIGCAGPDSDQLLAVLDEWSINPRSEGAQRWRAWVGMPPYRGAI